MFSTLHQTGLHTLPVQGAALSYDHQFISADQADALLEQLIAQVPWQQAELKIYGRHVLTQRLTCWMGDKGASYVYSNTRFEPLPWISPVLEIKQRIESATGHRFNSVLLNYYRNGQDAMGWHCDDENELGMQPTIASLSLGAERRFLLRRKDKTEKSLAIELSHGSLLLMQGDTQKNYLHALPRTAKQIPARINLTFRKIL
ncbi:MAG: alpha-ketoglutarate-dependent dioxygenase AlkB [Arenimonas sp.]|nr:alpha-ketoglutarate-dependent dioxygenase AlkB [Arenimonas sp.]